MTIEATYLAYALDTNSLRERVESAIEDLKAVKYDAIAVRGNSGTIFGGALSYATGKPLILVRKPHDKAHSSLRVEGYVSAKTYIFVDDLIDSGGTLEAVVSALEGRCVGAYLYNNSQYRSIDFLLSDHFWLNPSVKETLKRKNLAIAIRFHFEVS